MKTCEQMTADVFRRMDEYKIKQKKRRKIIAAVAAPLCSLCLVTAVGLWLGGGAVAMDNAAPESAAMNGSVYYSEDAESLQESPVNNDVMCIYEIFIQELEEVPEMQTHQNICLLVDDFIPMTDQELNTHFGVDIFPDVPEDLTRWDQQLGLYRRDGGTGELYWDGISVYYTNEEETRTVAVNVLSGNLPLNFGIWYETQEYSVICDTQIAIAKAEGWYFAEFMYEDVGFCVVTQGLNQQELVDVITSLIP